MIDYEKLQAQWAERCERLRVANNADRGVKFDGYADSGQIDDVVISGRESLAGEVAITDIPWNGPDEARTCPLSEALENLCYALLEQEHAGWQDNDGAYGTFVFDVPARTVIPNAMSVIRPIRLQNMCSAGRGEMAHPYHHALSSVRK